MKYRFLTEYANFKKKYYAKHAQEPEIYNAEYCEMAVKKISMIVTQVERGMVTLDDAMRAISEV